MYTLLALIFSATSRDLTRPWIHLKLPELSESIAIYKNPDTAVSQLIATFSFFFSTSPEPWVNRGQKCDKTTSPTRNTRHKEIVPDYHNDHRRFLFPLVITVSNLERTMGSTEVRMSVRTPILALDCEHHRAVHRTGRCEPPTLTRLAIS